MKLTHMVAAVVVLAAALAGTARAQQASPAAQLYTANCAVCHGAAGTPAPGMAHAMGAMPDFATVRAPADSVWISAITAGKGKMPGFGSRLQPAQIRALVTYLRSLKK